MPLASMCLIPSCASLAGNSYPYSFPALPVNTSETPVEPFLARQRMPVEVQQ